MNSLAVPQNPSRPTPLDRVLISSAAPTIPDTPNEVSHNALFQSKYRTTKTTYQSR